MKCVCRDPNDDMLIECAMNANASIIISGDKDVLCLGQYENVRILTARQYLEGFTFSDR
jgi:predicted nucleic acid-binding protein